MSESVFELSLPFISKIFWHAASLVASHPRAYAVSVGYTITPPALRQSAIFWYPTSSMRTMFMLFRYLTTRTNMLYWQYHDEGTPKRFCPAVMPLKRFKKPCLSSVRRRGLFCFAEFFFRVV